jgi:hypothetical protein
VSGKIFVLIQCQFHQFGESDMVMRTRCWYLILCVYRSESGQGFPRSMPKGNRFVTCTCEIGKTDEAKPWESEELVRMQPPKFGQTCASGWRKGSRFTTYRSWVSHLVLVTSICDWKFYCGEWSRLLTSYVGLLPCASTICRAATVIIIAAAKGEAQ